MAGEISPVGLKIRVLADTQAEQGPHGGADDVGLEHVRAGLDQGDVEKPEAEGRAQDGTQVARVGRVMKNNMSGFGVQNAGPLFKYGGGVAVALPGQAGQGLVRRLHPDVSGAAQLRQGGDALRILRLGADQQPPDQLRRFFHRLHRRKNPRGVGIIKLAVIRT